MNHQLSIPQINLGERNTKTRRLKRLMSSNDYKPVFPAGNPTNHNDPDHVAGTVNLQDQLLEALQQFIILLVGTAVGQTGSNQNLQVPEAMKLITALKEFISSIVKGSESKAKTMIEVNLEEEVYKVESTKDVGNADDGQELEVSTLPNIFGNRCDVFYDYTFHEYFLRRLREHVFNKMPIRLLCCSPQGSHLRISLVDKDDIYAHLVSVMEEHTSDPDYRPMEVYPRGPMETGDKTATRLIQKYAGYAILSHTWLRASPGEVTYANWTNGTFDRHSAGYQKLVNFCSIARENHGLTLGWMDTVCINKDSSSELDESIRSMYNWYKRSKVCIIYLATTQTISDIHLDPWFARGWTLQELLAPDYLKFYNQYWMSLIEEASNDKQGSASKEIRAQILTATTITSKELKHIFDAPLSRRMQLAASRKVTREEDMAYSLMGIFNVSISTAYGEGAERAFRRLLSEILNSTSRGVLDIFNWSGINSENPISQLLPSSPGDYINRSSNISLRKISPLAPLTITHMGIYIPVLLIPTVLARDQQALHNPIGDYRAKLTISMKYPWDDIFTATTLLLLDTKAFDADKISNADRWHQVAVFNIKWGSRGIYIPNTCIAKLLHCYEPPGQVTSMGFKLVCNTKEPLVFDMKYTRQNNPDNVRDGFWIPEDDLARHGMQFISIYL